MTTFHTESTEIEFQSKGMYDYLDTTEQIKDLVEQTGVENGMVNIQTFHTTTSIILNEKETGLIEDIKKTLDALIPMNEYYQHDDFEVRTENICDDECRNGHSHCKAIRLPVSLTLNVLNGELQLGQWQKILFFELDRARTRRLQILVMGEKKNEES